MEFRLNKIDPDVRQRIKETTSAGKIHNKTGIVINKDYKDRGKDRHGDFEKELIKYKGKNKKRIFVEASKVEEVKVNAFKGEGETVSKDDKRGNILDVKK